MAEGVGLMPQLRKVGSGWELLVDGKPYLILGAEPYVAWVGLKRYRGKFWYEISNMGVNTVIITVPWCDIEPDEGMFVFKSLDWALAGPRVQEMRVIVRWYGSRNISCTPSWIQADQERFPRNEARYKNGNVCCGISMFSPQCVQAESAAFKALMGHLKKNDQNHTVIMVQLEDTSFLLRSGDGSSLANEHFQRPVPSKLLDFLVDEWDSLLPDLKSKFPGLQAKAMQRTKQQNQIGSWEEYFGKERYAHDIFAAYYFSLHLDKIAAAGKQAYNIPIFTTAEVPPEWRVAASESAEEHCSSHRFLDIWYKFSPALDFVSLKTYTEPKYSEAYHGSRLIWEAIGRRGALGATPAGLDFPQLDIWEFLETWTFAKHYQLLGAMMPQITEARMKPDSITGFAFPTFEKNGAHLMEPVVHQLGSFKLYISPIITSDNPSSGYGIIIALGPAHFLLIGTGYNVKFECASPAETFEGIAMLEEKSVLDLRKRVLRVERRLELDETERLESISMRSERTADERDDISRTIFASRMIAEVHIRCTGREDITELCHDLEGIALAE
ncbi:family 35 putative beta-galactosidase glycoside hydrolase [Dactylonectria macrodidyma]|uniref:Family 35 putative beta-galactosidase glycoside hydrolase n=1 Tax=Dactylonectria macrodidyma TaxID=307937 RepID=A0A9P9EAR5_9HYPO|nr:family 35 putative beta-galactosidase glycoside hydrolase [Dactylonectria macrodidyma]